LDVLRAWAFEHGFGWFQNSVRRRPYAPDVAADARPVPLFTIRRFVFGCCDALRSRARQAGRDIAFGVKSDVPSQSIPDYPHEQFIEDLLREHETEIRRCLQKGAHKVQIDFTEARLAMKVDPSGRLLDSFVDLNNLALSRFAPEERRRIGVHTCPGGDLDSTHSIDVDYADLLPRLLDLKVGNFYIALACEQDRRRVLEVIRRHLKPHQRIFVGVIAVIDPRIETPEEVRDRVLEAVEYIPIEQLGTTDDCGFAPFSDDTSRTRDTAFEKIRARVVGTELAAKVIGGLS